MADRPGCRLVRYRMNILKISVGVFLNIRKLVAVGFLSIRKLVLVGPVACRWTTSITLYDWMCTPSPRHFFPTASPIVVFQYFLFKFDPYFNIYIRWMSGTIAAFSPVGGPHCLLPHTHSHSCPLTLSGYGPLPTVSTVLCPGPLIPTDSRCIPSLWCQPPVVSPDTFRENPLPSSPGIPI